MGIRRPFLQHIGAVRHPVLGLGVIGAVLLHARLMHGIAGLVRQQLQEIRRRPLQRDLQRLVVDRPDAEVLQLRAFQLLVDLLRILDREKDVGVFRASFRIDDAAEGENVVRRLEVVAVRPFGVGAQLEGVDCPVAGLLVALGDAIDDFALGVVDHQAVPQVARQMRLGDNAALLHIQRFRVAVVAAVERHLREGGGRQQRGGG
jgi:hypothetical protein